MNYKIIASGSVFKIKNVLLIEDEMITALVIQTLLKQHFPKIVLHKAVSLQEALDIYNYGETGELDRKGMKIDKQDMAIVDHRLKGEGTGLDFIKQVRLNNKRIILIANSVDNSINQEMVAAGAEKDVNMDKNIQILLKWLEKKKAENIIIIE